MHSISTSTFLGSCLTATQLRAGLWVNHLAYSSFMLCFLSQVLSANNAPPPGYLSSTLHLRKLLETHREVGHVGDEDVDLDDLVDAGAGLLQHGLEVLAALGRLLLDGARDEVAVLVGGDLAGAVDGAGGLDGVGVGGGGCVAGELSVSLGAKGVVEEEGAKAYEPRGPWR